LFTLPSPLSGINYGKTSLNKATSPKELISPNQPIPKYLEQYQLSKKHQENKKSPKLKKINNLKTSSLMVMYLEKLLMNF